MPNTWFTADTHLGHANIIKFCLRPFLSPNERKLAEENPRGDWRVSPETVSRHDTEILDAINVRVQPEDTLWILGDFCWGRLDVAKSYRARIACRTVHLVWGNHDHRSIRPAFDEAIEQGQIKIDGQGIWLNHYPMRSWHKSFHGSWHLYGHVHGRLDEEDRRNPWLLTKDVGVDACDYRPVSYSDLKSYMAPREAALAKYREELLENDGQANPKFMPRGSLA